LCEKQTVSTGICSTCFAGVLQIDCSLCGTAVQAATHLPLHMAWWCCRGTRCCSTPHQLQRRPHKATSTSGACNNNLLCR
jgi:hypothetical protein